MTAKVQSPAQAVALIPDGCTLASGGFAITRNVIAIVHELIRARRRDLTLVQVVGGMDTDLLVGAGCVRRLLYSGGSLDRFGFLNAVNRAVLAGALQAVEYSSLALSLRLHAGALGLPFLPTRSMLGSDLLTSLLASGEVREGRDPFTGDPVVLLPGLRPDVAVVHVDRADPDGNASIAGPTWTIRDTAFASSAVVLLCEELVPRRSIPPRAVSIPAAIVTAVVPVPRGAHPTAVFRRYDFDRAHLEEYVALSSRPRGMASYLEKYVYSVDSHRAYLDLTGTAR